MKCSRCNIILNVNFDNIKAKVCSDCEDEDKLNILLETKPNKIKPVKSKMRKIKLTDY